MKKLRSLWVAAFAMLVATLPVQAQQGLRPAALYAQLGFAEHGTTTATVGAVWPWSWRTSLFGGELGGQTEAFASWWRADDFGGGHQSYLQLGLLPVLRLRFDQGRSNWFVEAGIGVTWMDKIFSTPNTQFSTSGNFHDMLGAGYSWGANHEHEIGLRLVHISNASLKRPNPGIEFLQLKYGRRF